MSTSDHDYHALMHPGCPIGHDTAIQDERAGAELRLLLGVVPEEYEVRICSNWRNLEEIVVAIGEPLDGSRFESIGATVAEAARKCREALAT